MEQEKAQLRETVRGLREEKKTAMATVRCLEDKMAALQSQLEQEQERRLRDEESHIYEVPPNVRIHVQ